MLLVRSIPVAIAIGTWWLHLGALWLRHRLALRRPLRFRGALRLWPFGGAVLGGTHIADGLLLLPALTKSHA